MNRKKLGMALLFPHVAIMILLLPIAGAALAYSFIFLETDSVISIVSYALSAYTLTVWCFRIPHCIRFFKTFKSENVYLRRWEEDDRLRVSVTLFGSMLWNTAYAAMQIWLGFFHHTFWFFSFGVYYLLLAVMRLFLASFIKKHAPREQLRAELKKYRACGWVLLGMNLALLVIVFFMLYWNRTFEHHMITTIAMAAYTFTSFTVAIINIVRYRKYQSPIYSASKAISLAAACVSMLTLTSTMLTTFSDGTMDAFSQKMMLGGVGSAVLAVVLTMAISMIVQSTKKLKKSNAKDNKDGK